MTHKVVTGDDTDSKLARILLLVKLEYDALVEANISLTPGFSQVTSHVYFETV